MRIDIAKSKITCSNYYLSIKIDMCVSCIKFAQLIETCHSKYKFEHAYMEFIIVDNYHLIKWIHRQLQKTLFHAYTRYIIGGYCLSVSDILILGDLVTESSSFFIMKFQPTSEKETIEYIYINNQLYNLNFAALCSTWFWVGRYLS